MNTIKKTKFFANWLLELKDREARARIVNRLEHAEAGNFGDHHNVDGPCVGNALALWTGIPHLLRSGRQNGLYYSLRR